MSTPSFNCSVFRSLTDNAPDPRFGLNWEDLVNLIGPPKPYSDKGATPLFSPAEMKPGETVSNKNVAVIHFGVLDLDHVSEEALMKILTNILEEARACYFVSSWSHKGGADCCVRLIVPFSRPVLPSEWPEFWPIFEKTYCGGISDKSTKDASRRYYFPAHPYTLVATPICELVPGSPCDVDALLASGGARNQAFTKSPHRADRYIGDGGVGVGVAGMLKEAKLMQLAGTWSRSYQKHQVMLGKALSRVLQGEPFAKETGAPGNLPEGRHATMYALVRALVEAFPGVLPTDVVALFHESVSKMGRMDDMEVFKAVTHKQEETRGALAALNMKAIGRPEGYSDAELEEFANRLNVPVHTLKNYFIIQKGKTFYILKPEGYIPLTKDEFESSFKYQLAPASKIIDCTEVTKTGLRDKKASEMVHEYGLVASSITTDMTAQMSTFDVATNTLIEAPCPIRVEPEYDQDVQTWLELLAGDDPEDVDRLLKWVTCVPDLRRVIPAVYLHGPGGVGKSLLGGGLARLWTTDAATGLEQALSSNFNEAVATCPFIFADETIAKVDTAKIRELIQSRRRPYLRKYMPASTLIGSVRVCLAANNDSLLRSNDDLTNDDISAITERFLEFRTTVKPRDFLIQFHKRNPERLKDWVEKDVIARHALWLNRNVVVPEGDSRFTIKSATNSNLALGMQVFSGLRQQVCLWLVNFLREPGKLIDPKLRHSIYVKKGELLVRSSTIADGWEVYVNNREGKPQPGSLYRALGGLSDEKVVRVGTKTVRMRQVHMESLKRFASETGYGTEKEMDEYMAALAATSRQQVEDEDPRASELN